MTGDVAASQRYYTRANRSFVALKDTFGIAYSYCGLANAKRMKGDFKAAFDYFKKAKSNYKKIGDRVSYAYTLWGEGTAFKMVDKLDKADSDFREAEKLFKQTGDERGLVYCDLALGEIAYLNGRKRRAATLFERAFTRAESFFFGAELKYCKRLLRAAETGRGFPFNLP